MLISKSPVLALAMLAGVLAPGFAQASSMQEHEMLSLAPDTRIEQRCNEQAMGVVSQEHHDMHPDELVAYAFANTSIKDSAIKAPGAAIRSRDKWYHLSYYCVTKDQGMDVESFEYKLGEAVPENEWSDHYLVH